MTENAELLFAELFHSLFLFYDELNVAKSVIIYFYIMSISIDVNGLEDHYQPSQPILELNHVHQGSAEKNAKTTLCVKLVGISKIWCVNLKKRSFWRIIRVQNGCVSSWVAAVDSSSAWQLGVVVFF